MGYTHYWRTSEPIEASTFARLSTAAAKIVSIAWDEDEVDFAFEYHQPKKDPEFSKELIRFNGVGDKGHETFFVTPESNGFCKTARKPYDVAVVAILCLLHLYTDGTVKVSSDGDESDWGAGLALARRVAPEATIPPKVRG